MMKNKLRWALALFCALLFSGMSQASNPDIELLRKRFIAQEMNRPVNDERVATILETFIARDSIWPGIDYSDVRRIGFQHTTHLNNMVQMALAYKTKGSKFYKNKQLRKAFDTALAYWVSHNFICENWWNNEIGTPQAMVSILLVMDKDLTPEQVAGILPIAGRAHVNAWGARQSGDRIKIAGLQAKQLLFTRDADTFDEIIKIIEGQIKVVTGQKGIQSDYSFHHREDRVNNTLSYGTGYVDAFAEWAAMVADTRYRFSDAQLQTAIDYYLDGICKQMVYGRTADTGIKNRDISRGGRGHSYSTATPERFVKTTDYRKDELENVIKARKGESFEVMPYAKFFWQTEHFVFQRPKYYTSVRMYSTRNANMEVPYNGEGLTNHYRADGTNYLSMTGYEYDKLPPVNDWRKIPGTTVMQKDGMPSEDDIQKWGTTEFVGGVTDGLYGAAVFDFASVHDPLVAKKSWFFFDDEYVCLGSGITARSNDPVATTMNQTGLNGDVTVMAAGGRSVLPRGDRKLDKASWVHHGNVGYIFPNGGDVHVSNDTQSGSWYQINRQTSTSKAQVNEDVFKLWIDHGNRPRGAEYAYVVMPAADVQAVEAAARNPKVTILANTPYLQAVKHNGLDMAYAVFYRNGSVDIAGGLSVGMDNPGMMMVQYDDSGNVKSLSVSDPARKQGKAHLTVNRKVEGAGENYRAEWDAAKGVSYIAIDLPQGDYAGESVTVKL